MNLFLFPENYQENFFCIQEVTDELLGHMRGHNYSFKSEITDRKGNFSQKKLDNLLEELLSLWTGRLRDGTDMDPSTGESVVESYIRERQEMYRSYLYVVMRCSLIRGAYAHVYGTIVKSFQNKHGITEYVYDNDAKEQPDFAFLLKQAKYLSQSWCVMADSEGNKRNEPYQGYDRHFGFHLYHVLKTPLDMLDSAFPPDSSTLTSEWKVPRDQVHLWTDEGNQKRFFIRGVSSQYVPMAEETEETDEDGYGADNDNYDGTDGYGTDEDDYGEPDYEDMDGTFDYSDDWEYQEPYADAEFEAGKLEQLEEEANRTEWLKYHARSFECKEEYLAACRRFTTLFENAKQDVLRGFHEDLEEIVDLYLVERGISPLMDTDKTLDVYSRVYDEACQQAERYERGSKWENM